MSQPAAVYVGSGQAITIGEVKSRVLAVGVALFFVYLLNFAAQAFVTFVKKQEGKKQALKKLLETCQVLYWFGIASLLSIYPPDFFGIHCAIFAYVSLIFVILLHIGCFVNKQICGRSVWAVFYILYHLVIMLWILITLIIGFIWSNQNYSYV